MSAAARPALVPDTPDASPAAAMAPRATSTDADTSQRERLRLQEQLARVAASVPGMICSFRLTPDGATSMPYASPAILDLYGVTAAAVAQSFAPIAAGIHPADASRIQASIESSARTLSPWHAEFRYLHPAKGEIWVEGHSIPQREADDSTLWHGYVQDITERKRAEANLLDADRRKDEFLAMLAHELRNPLAPIRNAAHILGLLDTGEPRVRWAQRIIEQQAAHLTRLVDDLLDVSRIVRDEIALKMEVIDFTAVARQVVEGTRPLIEAKEQEFRLELPTQPLWLRGDLVRLSQVLVNLIDNAVKYTPAHGRICVSAQRQGEEIEILVEDNGMGIALELLPHVFDLFQQESRTLDRARGGLGLGLTLVRRLVQAHGGQVIAESEGTGRGTRMRVRLPRHPLAPTAPLDEPAAGAGAAYLRILVVDDEAAVADSTALLLRLNGHRVQIARAGPAAIQIAAVFRPQVILLDIGLHGMDGFQTARQLRASPLGAQLYLIAVTGYGDAQARELARAAGFDHYLVKPVEPEHLKALLAGLPPRPAAT